MGIVVIGSVAFDDVITPSGKNFNAPGGSATYFSISASYFTKVKLVAVVGTDFPKKYIRLLEKKGVDLEGLQVKGGKTFRWRGRYGSDFNAPQTLATYLNLLDGFRPDLPKAYRNEEIVFLANIDPSLQLEVLNQVDRPRLIAADTINLWIGKKRKELLEVLRRVDVLIINEFEARELTGEKNLLRAGRQILSYGPARAVIKKGESGLLYISSKRLAALPAYPLKRVCDPTGAGDTFAGGFLGYLAKTRRFSEETFTQALAFGSIMASFNVEAFDIKALARLDKPAIAKRIKAFRQICSF